MSSNFKHTLVEDYEAVAKEYYEKAIEVLQAQLLSSSKNSRMRKDATQMIELLKNAELQKPLTAEQALQLTPGEGLEKQFV
ncbi:hypothetical protein ACHAO7_011772, partial [Fusarium culmorum]